MPKVDFFSMNQEAASPVTIWILFWLQIMRIRNRTSAGAIRFRAVPPMVWSAFRLMEAKLSSRENTAPIRAAISMPSSSRPCRAI